MGVICQAVRTHRAARRWPALPSEFVLAQLGLINPIIAVFAGIGVVGALRATGRRTSRPIRFLLALAAPLVLYMLVHSFHDRVQGNWLAPIYPTLALIASAAAFGERAEASTLLRRLKAGATPLGLTVSALALLYLALPLTVLGADDPSQLTRGWPQFSSAVDEMRRIAGADWIATRSYALTGELDFHLKSENLAHEIVDEERYAFAPPVDLAALGQRTPCWSCALDPSGPALITPAL